MWGGHLVAASLSTTLSREERGTDTVTASGPGDSWRPGIYIDQKRGFVLLDNCICYLVHDGHVLLDGGLVPGVVHHHAAQVHHVMEDRVALASGQVGVRWGSGDQVLARWSGRGNFRQVIRWGSS